MILIQTLLFLWIGMANIPSFTAGMPEVYYFGVESQVSVQMNGCNTEDIQVKVNPGNVYKRNDSTFVFVPQYETEDLKIKLYYKKVICEVKIASIKKLPELIPVFDNEKQGIIRIGDINKLGILKNVYPEDYPEQMKTIVYSFNIFVVNPSGATIYTGSVRGNSLNDGVIAALSNLKPGAKIIINNILVQNMQNGLSRIAINKELTISE